MDDAFVGTTTSRRQSQASQAELTRIRLELEMKEQAAKAEAIDDKPNEAVIFCEAVIQITIDVARALQRDKLLPDSAIEPLKAILKHWVRRQHACSSMGFRVRRGKRGFHNPYVLSLVALATLYIRSPILPRDLAIFAARGRIPYLRALRDSKIEVQNVPQVRKALTPLAPPTADEIKAGMVLYGCDEFMWPPLKAFFDGPDMVYSQFTTSFAPVGHVELTLFRVVRYLGLPDEFGTRVLRYMDLRKKARKWLDSIEAPHRHTKSFHTTLPPRETNLPCWNVGSMYDCCEHPTDRTLQIDILNVIRLNYGSHDGELPPGYKPGDIDKDKEAKIKVKLREEWQACLRHMREWVLNGGGKDDAKLATWGLLSQPALSSLRGKELANFCEYAEMMNDNDKVPVFMKPYAAQYRGMAAVKQTIAQKPSSSQRLSEQKEEWNWSSRCVDAKREFAGLEDGGELIIGDGRLTIDQVNKKERNYLLPVMYNGRPNDGRGVVYEWDEPFEFGIAWSMLNRFFNPTPLNDIIQESSADYETDFMVKSVDRSLAMVMNYLNLGCRVSPFRMRHACVSK